jgi:hypothetical protein
LLCNEVRHALRHFMQREPRTDQVSSLVRQIRSGIRCTWLTSNRHTPG